MNFMKHLQDLSREPITKAIKTIHFHKKIIIEEST